MPDPVLGAGMSQGTSGVIGFRSVVLLLCGVWGWEDRQQVFMGCLRWSVEVTNRVCARE